MTTIDLTLILAQAATGGALGTLQTISTASGPLVLVLVAFLVLKGEVRLKREVIALEKQLEEQRAEAAKQLQESEARTAEFKRITFATFKLGEKVADVVEGVR